MKKININQLPGHISSREDLTNEEKTILAAVWNRYNNTPGKSTGLVFASNRYISEVTGIDPGEIKRISKKLDRDGFFTYTPGKSTVYGDKPMAASYTINADAWKAPEDDTPVDAEYINRVYELIAIRDDSERAKAVNEWASRVKDREDQEKAVRNSFFLTMSDSWDYSIDRRKTDVDRTARELRALNDRVWGSRDITHLILDRQSHAKTIIDKDEAEKRKEAQHGTN